MKCYVFLFSLHWLKLLEIITSQIQNRVCVSNSAEAVVRILDFVSSDRKKHDYYVPCVWPD